MGSGQCNSERIMADIYGSQNNILLQTRLADAINKDDFKAKCDSLGQIWGNSVPGLHTWFQRKRASFFIESAIISAHGNPGIESPFYTNGLQLKRRLQKNKLVESNFEKRWIQKITCYKSGWRNLTERKLEQSKVWANIILLKNIKLLLLIPRLVINEERSAELKESTYSINTHHLLWTPTKSQKMLFQKLHLGQ